MAERRPQDWLQPDEEILHESGRHPLSVLDGGLGATFLIGLAVAGAWVAARLWPILEPYATVVTVLLTVVWLTILVALYWRVRTSRYVITSDRIYRAHGRLRFVLVQTTYDKVTDLHVHQSLFGRWWGFGTLVAQTAGTGLPMEGVRDPVRVKRRLEEARRAFIERLLAEHVAERAARAVPAGAEGAAAPDGAPEWVPVGRQADQVLWRGGPVGYTIVPAAASGASIMIVGLLLTLGGTMGNEEVVFLRFVGPLMAVFGLVSIAQAIIQYRYTRYEVHPWGVVVTSGWLSRRRVETTFDKVTDVATYQGFFARLLDYGNIKINTAGSNQAPVNFNGLARPGQVKSLIDEARRRADARRRR